MTPALKRVLLAFLFVALAGPAVPVRQVSASPAPSRDTQPPGQSENILFITADSLRADHLGCYGYRRATSPFLDSLVKDGAVLFTRAFAHASMTPISMPSFATGLYRSGHYVSAWGYDLNKEAPTLASLLRGAGFRTGFISNHPTIYLARGFEEGFDLYRFGELRAQEVTRQAVAFLRAGGSGPTFLWLHYMDTHHHYQGPQEYLDVFMQDEFYDPARTAPIIEGPVPGNCGPNGIPADLVENGINNPDYYIAKYDAAIRAFDNEVAYLCSALKELGLYEKTVIIISADHGELLDDHAYFCHGAYLYDPLIRIPLVIKAGQPYRKRVVEELAEASVDIAPTCLELVGVKTDTRFHGRSLVPLMAGTERHPRTHVLFDLGECGIGVRTREWKLIKAGEDECARYQLYHLASDPGERINRTASDVETLSMLDALLVEYERSLGEARKQRPNPSILKESQELLKSIHYFE